MEGVRSCDAPEGTDKSQRVKWDMRGVWITHDCTPGMRHYRGVVRATVCTMVEKPALPMVTLCYCLI